MQAAQDRMRVRRSGRPNKQWFVWYECFSETLILSEDDGLAISVIDEADLPEYLEEIQKMNLNLVSLQKAPLMYEAVIDDSLVSCNAIP